MGDRRLGQAWTPTQRIKNGALYVAARSALWATSRMGDDRRRRVGRAVGRLAVLMLEGARRRAEQRLTATFGPHPPVTATQVFETLGEDLADTVSLLGAGSASERMPLSAQARNALDAALARGRGVVFCTAHLGPIDVMAASVAELGYDVVTLARESYDPRFTALYDEMREKRRVRTIYRGRPGMETSVLRALRAGKLVGFPMDLAGRGMATCQVHFLGERSPIPLGPARLALAVGAPVVVGTPAPCHGRMETSVEAVNIDSDSTSRADFFLTQAIVAILERRIRALPAHWVWMHERRHPHRELPA